MNESNKDATHSNKSVHVLMLHRNFPKACTFRRSSDVLWIFRNVFPTTRMHWLLLYNNPMPFHIADFHGTNRPNSYMPPPIDLHCCQQLPAASCELILKERNIPKNIVKIMKFLTFASHKQIQKNSRSLDFTHCLNSLYILHKSPHKMSKSRKLLSSHGWSREKNHN